MSESELRAIVDELVIRQETTLHALAECVSDLYLIETGEKVGKPADAYQRLFQRLAPLVIDPEKLDQALGSDRE